MPIRGKAQKVRRSMHDRYGKEEGERVFYATANKQGRVPETWEKKAADPVVTLLARRFKTAAYYVEEEEEERPSLMANLLGGTVLGMGGGAGLRAGLRAHDFRSRIHPAYNQLDTTMRQELGERREHPWFRQIDQQLAEQGGTTGGAAAQGAWSGVLPGALAGASIGTLRYIWQRMRQRPRRQMKVAFRRYGKGLAAGAAALGMGAIGHEAGRRWENAVPEGYGPDPRISALLAGATGAALGGTRFGRRRLLSRAPLRTALYGTAAAGTAAPVVATALSADQGLLPNAYGTYADLQRTATGGLTAMRHLSGAAESVADLAAQARVDPKGLAVELIDQSEVGRRAGPMMDAMPSVARDVGGSLVGSSAGSLLGYLLSRHALGAPALNPGDRLTEEQHRKRQRRNLLVGLLGAAVGGAAGHFAGMAGARRLFPHIKDPQVQVAAPGPRQPPAAAQRLAAHLRSYQETKGGNS